METFRQRVAGRLWLLSGILGCSLLGCGRSDWGYVEGHVTLDGQPVGPGTLIFEPRESKSGPSAVGHLGSDGHYTLVSAGQKQGAPVGQYRVTIVAGDSSALADERITREEATSEIPRRYASPESGLTANINAGKQQIDFDLRKQAK